MAEWLKNELGITAPEELRKKDASLDIDGYWNNINLVENNQYIKG